MRKQEYVLFMTHALAIDLEKKKTISNFSKRIFCVFLTFCVLNSAPMLKNKYPNAISQDNMKHFKTYIWKHRYCNAEQDYTCNMVVSHLISCCQKKNSDEGVWHIKVSFISLFHLCKL